MPGLTGGHDGPLDFCILGAPKSGKTGLLTYLRTHPQVFIADTEPGFYADDIVATNSWPLATPRAETRQAYLEFFAGARDGQLLGELSGLYLPSERAVPNILRDSPHARFILFLRNPVDIAHSLHSALLRNLYENESSFQKAWNLQDARMAGERPIPRSCPTPKLLLYRERCAFAGHMERFFKRVPRERVLVHVFEEFFADPRASYLRTLAFLGLSDDGRADFPRINEHAPLRSRFAQRLVLPKTPVLDRIFWPIKAAFNAVGLEPRSALHRWNKGLKEIDHPNKDTEKIPTLAPPFRRQLEAAFRPEIARLEKILGRDLDVWTSH